MVAWIKPTVLLLIEQVESRLSKLYFLKNIQFVGPQEKKQRKKWQQLGNVAGVLLVRASRIHDHTNFLEGIINTQVSLLFGLAALPKKDPKGLIWVTQDPI